MFHLVHLKCVRHHQKSPSLKDPCLFLNLTGAQHHTVKCLLLNNYYNFVILRLTVIFRDDIHLVVQVETEGESKTVPDDSSVVLL